MTMSYRFTKAMGYAGALVTLLLSGGAQASPPTYPIICRSNGQMYLEMQVRNGGSPILTLYFTQASSPSNIQPGQCSWTDRAFYPWEPASIAYTLLANDSVTAYVANTWAGFGAESASDPDVKNLLYLTSNPSIWDQYYTFYVYNNGREFTKPGRDDLQ